MAKDRITIFIPSIHEDYVYVDNTWVTSKQKGNWSQNDNKEKRRRLKYTHGISLRKVGNLDVHYLKYNVDMGDILISLSVSELYFANNAIPKSAIDVEDLAARIRKDLKKVIDIRCISCWGNWVVSRDETNVDIIDSQENIARRLEVISKCCYPYRKVDNDFKNDGSVYFRGRSGKKSSGQVIAYDKIKEQEERKGVNLREILGLNNRQGCLRLESKTRKNPLKLDVDSIRQLSEPNRDDTRCNFDIVMSSEYQVNVLMKAISKLNLDKNITTRSNLIKQLRKSGKFTKQQFKTLIKVLNHENGDKYSHNLSKRTVNKYKNIIHSLGFHHIYSDVDLKPITREMVHKAVSTDLTHIVL